MQLIFLQLINLENGKLDHFTGRTKGKIHNLYPFWLNFDEEAKKFIVLQEVNIP